MMKDRQGRLANRKHFVMIASISLLVCVQLLQFAVPSTPDITIGDNAPEGIGFEASIYHPKNSATGSIFLGEKFRTYEDIRLDFERFQVRLRSSKKSVYEKCTRWGVVTTIFAPTEGVKAVARLPDWCLVVVADTKTPSNYADEFVTVEDDGFSSRFKFLSIEEQQQLQDTSSKLSDFVGATPLRHFSRKNIGYLYAIQHGAQLIFDFDDDNVLHNNVLGIPIHPLKNFTHLVSARVVMQAKRMFNHHSLMGASLSDSWARGFPLERIMDDTTQGVVAFERDYSLEGVGVIQLCANGNPDVDAVHRLTKPLPMSFQAESDGGKPVIVPSHTFAPYNAQATVHTYPSFFAMMLPSTVPGRVSDIWRGYFAEAIFRDLNLKVAFVPPRITQFRNAHDYLADMDAESDLYTKSGKLIEYLSSWSNNHLKSVPERMEQLLIDLYERGYIEKKDVTMTQLWLEALNEIGYRFPKLVRQRHMNVVMLGHFNYASELENVLFWNQKWQQVFYHTVVRGPFNESQIDELDRYGIIAHASENDRGYYSPIENLRRTLSSIENETSIDGVLYAHDDAILNMHEVFPEKGLPFDDIITLKGSPIAYEDMNTVIKKYPNSSDGYYINQNGDFESLAGVNHGHNWSSLPSRPSQEPWANLCMPRLQKVTKDAASDKYKDTKKRLLLPYKAQSDFMYIPRRLAFDFLEASFLMVKHQVFLECGFPAIIQMLRNVVPNLPVRRISLCTTWGSNRGELNALDFCTVDNKGPPYGMYHPIKLTKGLVKWDTLFESLTYEGRRDQN